MDNELWRWVWVAVAMVMGLGEIFTAGFFLLPFALGAVLAAAAAWMDIHGAVQWLLFFGGTAVSMAVLRRFMGRQDRPDDLPVGANRYVGMHARVVEVIDMVNNTGRVRVESDEWRAVSDAGHIEEGSLVRITALQGTKLQVEFEDRPPDDYVPVAAAQAPNVAEAEEASNEAAVTPPADDGAAAETAGDGASSEQSDESATSRSD